jgi:hypothetical protein
LTDRVRSIAMGSAIVRRSAVGGARFGENMAYDEDTLFWVSAMAGAAVVTIERPVLIYHVSLERADERFAIGARGNFLAASRHYNGLVRKGTITKKTARARKQLLALKTARVLYRRGNAASAARFLRLAHGANELDLVRQWQAFRYRVRVALAQRENSPSSDGDTVLRTTQRR